MVYLRTLAGGFLKSDSIVALAPRHGDDGQVVGWMAVRPDGSTAPLARFYSAPGRGEKTLPHLFPSPNPVGQSRRRFIVPYTNARARPSTDASRALHSASAPPADWP
jgi:hypothetical protein